MAAVHHLHSILRHLANRAFLARPVGVGELGNNVATFFQSIEAKGNSKLAAERALHTDLDVVVVNKYSYILSFLHVGVLMPGVGGGFVYAGLTAERINCTISSNEDPGGNTAATPSSFNFFPSSSGIIPPAITATSSISF
jgi:hypothetical protein